MPGEIPQERERLNDEIEKAYINLNYAVADILTWQRFGRGMAMIDIYQTFYRNLCDLVELTRDLHPMEEKIEEIDKVDNWIHSAIAPTQDKPMLEECLRGIEAFKKYKKALINKSIITLPKG